MTGTFLLIIVCAGLLGLSVAALIWQLLPATPALEPAMHRLRPNRSSYEHPIRAHLRALADRIVPHADLAMLGRTPARYLTDLTAAALSGPAMLLIIALILGLAGLGIPFALPATVGLGFGAAAVVIVIRETRQRAKLRRADYRRGVTVYLDQVASVLAGGHGPVEAMERAATIGNGGVFDAIRAALASAKGQPEPPWDQLRQLGRQLALPVLTDIGETMTDSGIRGAKVYKTLRDKTALLRTAVRYDDLEEAKQGTTVLEVIGAVIVLTLIIIMAFPFVGPMLAG